MDGRRIAVYIETLTGVKQGRLLSPLPFVLYISDPHVHLEGGLNIEDNNIHILLYADDIVIIAEKLETYCSIWNIVINMGRSKIMVLEAEEIWHKMFDGHLNLFYQTCSNKK